MSLRSNFPPLDVAASASALAAPVHCGGTAFKFLPANLRSPVKVAFSNSFSMERDRPDWDPEGGFVKLDGPGDSIKGDGE